MHLHTHNYAHTLTYTELNDNTFKFLTQHIEQIFNILRTKAFLYILALLRVMTFAVTLSDMLLLLQY